MQPTEPRIAGLWYGGDFAGKDAITFHLRPHHVQALESALAALRQRGLRQPAFGVTDFDLGDIAGEVHALRDEVMRGRGIVIVRGFPVDRHEVEDMEDMFYGFGCHLGRAVSQSRMGDRLGHVTNVSGADAAERGYRSSKELSLHTDNDDIVAMLCLQPAASGGVNRFVSSPAVHAVLAREAPASLEPLYRGYHYHWKGEQPPDEPPVTDYRIPVFSAPGDVLSCCYLRDFMQMAWEELGEQPAPGEVAALDAFDDVCAREGMALDLSLERGEAFLINNHTVLHARSAFEEQPEPALRRHLLRLWLKCPGERPLHEALVRYYGPDGIVPSADGGTYYTGKAL